MYSALTGPEVATDTKTSVELKKNNSRDTQCQANVSQEGPLNLTLTTYDRRIEIIKVRVEVEAETLNIRTVWRNVSAHSILNPCGNLRELQSYEPDNFLQDKTQLITGHVHVST